MKLRALLCSGWLVCAAAAAFAAAGEPAASVASEDIRDIRGPRAPSGRLSGPLLAVGAAALALTAAGTAYAVYRWRRHKPAVPLLPHELALQRLESLHTQLPALGTAAFAVAASDIVRSYIEVRFGVTVTRRTTEEFLEQLLASPDSALSPHRPLLNEFLRRCDYAKFAGASMAQDSVDGMYRGAQTFIVRTAPQEPHDPVSAA